MKSILLLCAPPQTRISRRAQMQTPLSNPLTSPFAFSIEAADSLGINMPSLRFQPLIMVSLLASFPKAFNGTIGFIGQADQHSVR